MKILDNEYWYCGVSNYGFDMPLSAKSKYRLCLKNNPTPNQMTSVLLSSKGRFIYSNDGFYAEFDNGNINLSGSEEIAVYDGGRYLKDAYIEFMHRYGAKTNIELPSDFILKPIYNTWIELAYDQREDKILKYAKSILDNGFEAGTIIIDDGWFDYYGKWQFSRSKFHNPKAMIEKLHDMGYRVMLWICPYVSPDSEEFRFLNKKRLILENDGEAFLLRWWNGFSACLDFRKNDAKEFLNNQLDKLMELGIDGFKFDGGDSSYYLPEHEGDLQSNAWAEFGAKYRFNELRADFNNQGMSILERLCDKKHIWGKGGIESIIPDTLSLGLGGHPISSPDMIGGGEINDFINKDDNVIDKELVFKNLCMAILMPSVQYSVNLARIMPDYINDIHSVIRIRKNLDDYYMKLFNESAKTKEPIIRYMEYEYPNIGLSDIVDQYALGDKYIVAPIYKKGEKKRKVYLPKGIWKDLNDKTYEIMNNCECIISDSCVGLFEKIDCVI